MNSKQIIALICCLPVCLCLACQDRSPEPNLDPANNTPFQQSAFRQTQAASIELLADSPLRVSLQVKPGDLNVGLKLVHDKMFSTLDCDSCGWTNELGKPRLPVVRRFVEIPAGAKVTTQYKASDRQTIRLADLGARHQILPVQRPVEKLPGAAERTPFEMDTEHYARDAFYPAQDVSISQAFMVRGHWLVMVETYPLQYNPVRSEIRRSKDARLELSFLGGTAKNAPQKRFSSAFDAWFKRNVINYQSPATQRDTSTAKYADGLLYIVGNAYAADNGLLNYIETRRAEGHYVEMVPVSDIGNTDTQLRTYIRNQYLTWSDPGLSYVVLVGDVDDVATHTGTANNNSQATDLYYASIEPDNYAADLLAPDLFVSRISVNNAAELATYLTRADTYLYADFQTDTSWMNKISWIASCDNYDITEGTHDYVINTYTSAAGYTGTYPNDPQSGGDLMYCNDGGATDAIIGSTIGDGRLMINFSGHGGELYWADPHFDQSGLNGVLPPDAAPFVISNACITGSFAYSSDCWGEMWLAHSAGAILFWGSSNNSYWDEDDILEKRLWDGVFSDGITRFADITRNAKLETLAHYGAVDNMEYYFEMYNNLGDATIDFYTGIPYDATALYPTQLPVGIGSISFAVTDAGAAVQGALVSLRGDLVQQVGYTDASGQVELILNPAPADVGDLQVTITAHNMKRHEGTIQIIPADGSYLVHESHEITSDGSTPIVPNPGRHVVMPITVKNIGTEAATGISTNLFSNSPAVSITQAVPIYSDILPDQTGRSTSHAEFDISAAAADGEVLDFHLDWTADGGYSGSSRFSVVVLRPVLVYHSHTVDDSGSGCDQDGFADENEPSLFQITIENQGSGDASQVAVTLSAADCINDGPASFGDIAAGQQAAALFSVTAQPGIACPAENLIFNLSASANELPDPDPSSFFELLNADVVSGSYSDDMESAEPNGWSHSAATGTDDWGYVADSAHSPTHSWFAADVGVLTDKFLETPSITIGDTAQLTFWHRFDFEDGYDGGVLEISVDGGSFSDLGNFITQGGYNSTISDWGTSPISGQPAWTDIGAWSQVIVDLSNFGPADVVIRFRLACDGSVESLGWWIDDLQLDADTVACQQLNCAAGNHAPVANAGVDQQVDEGLQVTLVGSASYDPNNDSLSYAWNQTAGPGVTLSDSQLADPTFIAPLVDGYVDLVFELTVADSEFDDSDSVTITIWGGCDDGNACTDDSLNGNACEHTATDCDDQNPCTVDSCDVATGCINDPLPNEGSACDDSNGCTQTDSCQSGICVGADPVICTALDACHDAGVCNQANGVCSDPAKPEGSSCDDGDACTPTDTCQSGACVAGESLVCSALDACHDAGVCDPETGVCTDPAKEDGFGCDDGDACTATDTCQAGVCVAGDATVCTALDACHEIGVCDPQSGICSDPPMAEGANCDNGDPCTTADTCQAGVCEAGDPITCTAQDACHVAGVCDPQTGTCTNPAAADDLACDDEDACTQTDTCQAGVCLGSNPQVCTALDSCHESGVCDPYTGICSNPESPDGTECAEGTCQAGECTAEDSSSSGCGCSQQTPASQNVLLFGLFLGLILAATRRKNKS